MVRLDAPAKSPFPASLPTALNLALTRHHYARKIMPLNLADGETSVSPVARAASLDRRDRTFDVIPGRKERFGLAASGKSPTFVPYLPDSPQPPTRLPLAFPPTTSQYSRTQLPRPL